MGYVLLMELTFIEAWIYIIIAVYIGNKLSRLLLGLGWKRKDNKEEESL